MIERRAALLANGSLLLSILVASVVTSCGAAPPRRTSASKLPWPPPSLRIAELPDQPGLYGLIVKEYARLGWKTVCVGVHSGNSGDPVDPPQFVAAAVRSADPRFRMMSECRLDGDEVIDRAGGRDPVAVTLAGADRDGPYYLVRVVWCCWVGFGTFRVVHGAQGWTLKGTEGWLQS